MRVQKIRMARFVLLAGLLTFGAFLLLAWFFGDILWEWEQKTRDGFIFETYARWAGAAGSWRLEQWNIGAVNGYVEF